MRNKKFDCVEMKRKGAKEVFEKTSKMTKEEEFRFWQERFQVLKQRQREETKPQQNQAGNLA